MTDLRRMFYNRYKTSSIFASDVPSKTIIKENNSSKIDNQKAFSPKYNRMTSKERYWHEMRFKDDAINKKKELNSSNNLKRNHSIKEVRKQKKLEEKKK